MASAVSVPVTSANCLQRDSHSSLLGMSLESSESLITDKITSIKVAAICSDFSQDPNGTHSLFVSISNNN